MQRLRCPVCLDKAVAYVQAARGIEKALQHHLDRGEDAIVGVRDSLGAWLRFRSGMARVQQRVDGLAIGESGNDGGEFIGCNAVGHEPGCKGLGAIEDAAAKHHLGRERFRQAGQGTGDAGQWQARTVVGLREAETIIFSGDAVRAECGGADVRWRQGAVQQGDQRFGKAIEPPIGLQLFGGLGQWQWACRCWRRSTTPGRAQDQSVDVRRSRPLRDLYC